MNTRFKLALWSLTRRNNRGFALAFVIFVGVLMAGTSVLIMARAQHDETKVKSQARKTEALSVAEVGVTQYVNMLNYNRELALYPDCAGTRTSTGSCTDGSGVASWRQAIEILSSSPSPSPSVSPSPSTCPNSNNNEIPGTVTPAFVESYWSDAAWKVAPGFNNGFFRLVSYRYQPDDITKPNSTPGTATLVVQGQLGNNDKDILSSTNQVAVTFRVASQTEDMTIDEYFPGGPPGLWAQSFNLNGSNKSEDFRTNVLDSSGCSSGQTSFPRNRVDDETLLSPPFAANTEATYTAEVKSFPKLPSLDPPSGVNVNDICLADGMTLPRLTDLPERLGSTTYHYRNTCNFTMSKDGQITFGVTGLETIKIYSKNNSVSMGVNGNGGQPKYNLRSVLNKTTTVVWILGDVDFKFGGNADANNGSAKNFQIYLHGDNEINLHGNPELRAFIFAPYSNAVYSGNIDFAGALWSKSYRDNGATGNYVQTITKDDLNALEVKLPPEPEAAYAMSTLDSWQLVEAQTTNLSLTNAKSYPVPSPSASTSPSPSPTASTLPGNNK